MMFTLRQTKIRVHNTDTDLMMMIVEFEVMSA